MTLKNRFMMACRLLGEFVIDSPNLGRCLFNSLKGFLKGGPKCEVDLQGREVLNVFLHGYVHDKSAFVAFRKAFHKEGLGSCLACSLGTTLQDLDLSAKEQTRNLRAILEEHRHYFRQPVAINLIGVSMGGLLALAMARDHTPNPHTRLNKVVAIGAPVRGTELAFLGIGRSARQMRRQSHFLEKLARDMRMRETGTLYFAATRKDEIIYPWRGCFLWDEGEKHPRQAAFNHTGHFGLLFDEEVISWLVRCIKE